MSRSLKLSNYRKQGNAGFKTGILLLLLSGIFFMLPAAQGYASLKIAGGAREAAMGEAGVAGTLSGNALRWNPALMAQGPAVEVSLHHTRWLVGTSQSALLFKRRLGRVSLGAEALYFTSGEIELRDSVSSPEPEGTYSFADLSLGFGAAFEVIRGTRIGIVGRYYNERLWTYSAHTWGFDVGLDYTPLPGFDLGFSVLDFGFEMYLDAEGFKPPMTIRVGGAWAHDWTDNLATALNLDFLYRPYDKEPGLRTGLEVKLFNLLALRAGAKMLYMDEELELISPTELLTFGVGVQHRWVSLDYALVPYNRLDLGLTHRVSLNLSFD
jgi:hypothetical protein